MFLLFNLSGHEGDTFTLSMDPKTMKYRILKIKQRKSHNLYKIYSRNIQFNVCFESPCINIHNYIYIFSFNILQNKLTKQLIIEPFVFVINIPKSTK